MKKILAILMSAILLLGLLAGCGNQPDDSSSTNDTVATPVAAGMLVLNAGAAVNISYDSDGLVVHVEGADDNGTIVAAAYTSYLGKPVAEAVRDVIGQCGISDFLSAGTSFVLIKQAYGSALPGTTFLETINSEAVVAVKEYSPAKVILLTGENLDANGYINLDSAKQLLLAHLVLENFDTLDGTVTPIDGLYSFAVTAGDMNARFIVDGVTGSVCEGELDDVNYGDVYLGEESEFVGATDETFLAEDPTVPAGPEPSEDPTIGEVAE